MNKTLQTINIRGQLFSFNTPIVMGILNVTPDSFYSGSRKQTEKEIADRCHQIINEGGTIIDIGAFSTRPGGVQVTLEEEMSRLKNALTIVKRETPNAIISIDTFRPEICRMAVEEYGADIINDVSEGGITGIANVPLQNNNLQTGVIEENIPLIFKEVSRLKVPYILMSVQSNLKEMIYNFSKEISILRSLGAKDIILDPGFGFGKTLEQNYAILQNMEMLHALDLPILVGASRKSMIYKLFNTTPQESLNGTSIIHTISLMKGASILRVHDVKECVEAVKIVEICKKQQN